MSVRYQNISIISLQFYMNLWVLRKYCQYVRLINRQVKEINYFFFFFFFYKVAVVYFSTLFFFFIFLIIRGSPSVCPFDQTYRLNLGQADVNSIVQIYTRTRFSNTSEYARSSTTLWQPLNQIRNLRSIHRVHPALTHTNGTWARG